MIKQNNPDFPINPIIVLTIGILGVSTGSIFARLADSPALVTAAYRVGLASLVILPLAAWKAEDELRNLSFHDVKMAVLSGLFLALHFATWISSLDYTAIANSVVLVNTIPLWVLAGQLFDAVKIIYQKDIMRMQERENSIG